MKIALITPPCKSEDIKTYHSFPVALGHIDSYLKEHSNVPNLETRIYDFYQQIGPSAAACYLDDWRPDILGISLSSLDLLQYGIIQGFIKEHKKENKDVKVVLGGLVPTFIDKEIAAREPDIDYLVGGEGEETFVELVRCLYNSDDVSGVKGITYKENGTVRQNPSRAPPKNLDELPLPTREIFDLKSEKIVDSSVLYGLPIPIIDSRGCEHNRCTFCGIDRPFRRRSPDNIIEELKILKPNLERHGKELTKFCVVFESDSFKLDGAAKELAEKISADNLTTTYIAQTRAEEVIKADEKVLDALERAYFHITIGAESFNDSQLRRWQKFKPEVKRPARITEKALKRLADKNMLHSFFMIWADPQTTKKELKRNLKGMLKWISYLDRYTADTMYLSPGSADWYNLKKNDGADVYLLREKYNHTYPMEILELEYLIRGFNGVALHSMSEHFRELKSMFFEPLLYYRDKDLFFANRLMALRHDETQKLRRRIKPIYKWALKLDTTEMMLATSSGDNPFRKRFNKFAEAAREHDKHLVSLLEKVRDDEKAPEKN